MPRVPKRQPSDKPQSLSAPALRTLPPAEGPGRKKKLDAPPLPQEVLEAMSELEQQHFKYFKQCIYEEYPDLTPFERIQVEILALNYISVLRMETKQLASGELITMTRIDPRTQYLRILDALAMRRKDKKQQVKEEKSELTEALSNLWKQDAS